MRWDNVQYSVYIITNQSKSVLYTGVTNNLQQRIIEHYLDRLEKKSFAGKYNAFYLLYYESYQYIDIAISREKEIKSWRREKKMNLIRTINPNLEFLNFEVFDKWPPADIIHSKDIK